MAKRYGRVSETPRFPGENAQEKSPQIVNHHGESKSLRRSIFSTAGSFGHRLEIMVYDCLGGWFACHPFPLRALTSLNKEAKPFFLGGNSIWSFPSASSLSDYSIWGS